MTSSRSQQPLGRSALSSDVACHTAGFKLVRTLLLVAAVAAAATASPNIHVIRGAANATVAPPSGRSLRGSSEGVGGVSDGATTAAASAPTRRLQASGNGITYHGGPVLLNTVNVYYIWYGNWASDSGVSILTDFASHVSGSSWWNIQTTYTNGGGASVSNAVAYRGATTVAYPYGTSLSDANIQSVVSDAITAGTVPLDSNAVYFVLTSADVTASSGFCTQYCGWHDHASIAGVSIKYAFIGNAGRCISACGHQSVGPNGNAAADAMASVLAHELAEAVSDPELNAWTDSNGEENAVSVVMVEHWWGRGVCGCGWMRAGMVLVGTAKTAAAVTTSAAKSSTSGEEDIVCVGTCVCDVSVT